MADETSVCSLGIGIFHRWFKRDKANRTEGMKFLPKSFSNILQTSENVISICWKGNKTWKLENSSVELLPTYLHFNDMESTKQMEISWIVIVLDTKIFLKCNNRLLQKYFLKRVFFK